MARAGVAVTAFGENPHGAGLILRLWEQGGEDGSARACLPEALAIRTVQPADLRGRPAGSALPVRAGCFEAALRHDAPASYLLRSGADSR